MENEKQTNEEHQNDKNKILKCSSCGANLTENFKKCEYCGSLNPNYQQKELKQTKQAINKSKNMFGGLFGNVFDEILNNFDEK